MTPPIRQYELPDEETAREQALKSETMVTLPMAMAVIVDALL